MGLDMYLNKFPRHNGAKAKDIDVIENYLAWKEEQKSGSEYAGHSFYEWCHHEESEVNAEMLEFYKPYYTKKYSTWDTEQEYGYYRISEQIGYWRKANQIHNWFVQNVQNGEDECDPYEVSKYELQELLDICKKIKSIAVMKSGKIMDGYSYKNGKRSPIYEDGVYIENAEEVEKLLPTADGFFFGGTSYDQYYMSDIDDTIEILTRVLEETDFDKEVVYYVSSW